MLKGFDTSEEQHRFVLDRVQRLLDQGVLSKAVAVFARMGKQLNPLRELLVENDVPVRKLSAQNEEQAADGVSLGTMHRAKGLEFKVVFVIDCCDDNLPLKHVAKKIQDSAEKEEFHERERKLLYVSITRARDEAFLLWSGEPSGFIREFLESGCGDS